MKLKTAYFRLRGLKETDDSTGARAEALGHAKQLGMAKLGGHNLVFWLQMIINERQAASRSLPCEFASEAMVRLSQVARHWDTEMRYRDAVRAAGEDREVAFAASWLLQNERVLWSWIMPVHHYSVLSKHNRHDLVDLIAKDLAAELKPGQAVSYQSPELTPEIFILESPNSNSIQVTVVGEFWTDVPEVQRPSIILDAFAKAGRRGDVKRITVAMGLTRDEADGLGYDWGSK